MSERTEIGELGEFGLIKRIQEKFLVKNKETILGIGDDASILNFEESIVISSELFSEGIDFDLSYTPLKHLGYKIVSASVSDIAAMNAFPKQLLVNLGLSNRISVEAVDELYEGIQAACDDYGIDLVGGDIRASVAGLVISTTCTGANNSKNLVKRSGAKANDIICVTGDLGAAVLGLMVLEREKEVFKANPNSNPEMDQFSYVVERHLMPKARLDIIHELKDKKIVPTSMIDCSDGLASDLIHLSNANNLGVRIFEKNLPIEDATYLAATDLNFSPITAALNGGEDYELIFTISQKDFDSIKTHLDISPIGFMVENSQEKSLVLKSEQIVNLTAPGFPKEMR